MEEDPSSNNFIQVMLQGIPHLFSNEDNHTLSQQIEEEEAMKVIWNLNPDKALGPDGLTTNFYHEC